MKAETHAETTARQERQVASRVVTRKPGRCPGDAAGIVPCAWCSTKAPRPKHLLVNGLKPLALEGCW